MVLRQRPQRFQIRQQRQMRPNGTQTRTYVQGQRTRVGGADRAAGLSVRAEKFVEQPSAEASRALCVGDEQVGQEPYGTALQQSAEGEHVTVALEHAQLAVLELVVIQRRHLRRQIALVVILILNLSLAPD